MGKEGLEKHPVSEPALDRLSSNTSPGKTGRNGDSRKINLLYKVFKRKVNPLDGLFCTD